MNVEVEFSELWTTKIVRRRLPHHEAPSAALKALMLEDEAREDDYTARFLDQNLFERDHPGVAWLKAQVDETASTYLHHVGVRQQLGWAIHGWYNRNKLGDHHAPHSHPWSYLSGTYYLQVPEAPEPGLGAGSDAHPGAISFYDPRSSVNMGAQGAEPDARAAFRIRPLPGTLMMWPSPVQHYIHPNLSRTERITISFNLMLRPGHGAPEL